METKLEVRSFDSPLTPEAFRKLPKRPVTVILDNLRSAFNVGSIIRTADCTRIDRVICCGITAHPPHRKLEKTSLGSLDYVTCEYRKTVMEAVLELKAAKIPVIALELTNRSRILWETQFPEKLALILGNEALGVSQEILREADEIVEIPVLGFKNSMNVAVAFGIVMYEIQRQHWERADKELWEQNRVAFQKACD
jgi:tRNA G18 (ribose-2'-O)-methylase SpoU